MRKVISLLAVLALILGSCSNEIETKPNVVQYAESLISKYPNFASNEIAKVAVKDSISCHIRSIIGKSAMDLDGVEFRFEKLLDGKNGKCAVFTSSSYASVDAPANSRNKYVGATIKIIAFGNVDDAIAAKLDKNMKYSIHGKLHEWDGDNALGIITSSSYDDLDFGTYILDDMKVEEYESQEKL